MKALSQFVVMASIVVPLTVSATDKATAPEAEALVKKAVAYVKNNGKEKAIAEFNNPNGQFRQKDLYIVAFEMTGMGLAHPNPKLIGKATPDIKDVDGKMIFREYVNTVSTKGSGWVDYKWPSPTSGAIEAKSTYVEKVDNIIVGAGIYK